MSRVNCALSTWFTHFQFDDRKPETGKRLLGSERSDATLRKGTASHGHVTQCHMPWLHKYISKITLDWDVLVTDLKCIKHALKTLWKSAKTALDERAAVVGMFSERQASSSSDPKRPMPRLVWPSITMLLQKLHQNLAPNRPNMSVKLLKLNILKDRLKTCYASPSSRWCLWLPWHHRFGRASL